MFQMKLNPGLVWKLGPVPPMPHILPIKIASYLYDHLKVAMWVKNISCLLLYLRKCTNCSPRKGKGNFCVKKNYNNNIPIQVPIPAQGWFVVQLQHTRLVAWSSSCSNAIGMVDLSSENPTKTNQHWWPVVYFEGKEEGYLLFNSMGGILSLFVGVRPLPLFKE